MGEIRGLVLDTLDPYEPSIIEMAVDRSNNCTHLIGLIGWPAKLGLSPTIYNAAFQALGLNWNYVPLTVPNGQLREALLGLRALGFTGAELAGPYQADALNYLEELSPAAEAVGAVQHVIVDERGRLVGDNVRWLGFLARLRALIPSLNGLRPLIIGAGDAARSIVYALTREGLPLTIVAERMEQAIDLVDRLRHVMDETNFSVYRWPQDLERVAPDANLVINTTTIGMRPEGDRSPWPDDVPFPSDAVAFDLVAWPSETRFLRQARASGSRTVSGLSLLVYEAALILARWTGYPPPTEVMWSVVEEALLYSGPSPLRRIFLNRDVGHREPGGHRRPVEEGEECVSQA